MNKYAQPSGVRLLTRLLVAQCPHAQTRGSGAAFSRVNTSLPSLNSPRAPSERPHAVHAASSQAVLPVISFTVRKTLRRSGFIGPIPWYISLLETSRHAETIFILTQGVINLQSSRYKHREMKNLFYFPPCAERRFIIAYLSVPGASRCLDG